MSGSAKQARDGEDGGRLNKAEHPRGRGRATEGGRSKSRSRSRTKGMHDKLSMEIVFKVNLQQEGGNGRGSWRLGTTTGFDRNRWL